MTVTPETEIAEETPPAVLTFDPGPPDPFITVQVPHYRTLADYFVDGRVAEVGEAVRFVCVRRSDDTIALNLEVIP